jgi:hypothetical protein
MARNRTLPYPFIATTYNGPRPAGEYSDCAVRALMTTTGSTYMEAHAVLADRCGRVNGQGTNTWMLERLLNSGVVLGCRFELIATRVTTRKTTKWGTESVEHGPCSTLAKFIRENPVGTFYVLKRGHAFAVVNGTLIDTWKVGPRSRCTQAWKVTTMAKKVAKKVVRGASFQNVVEMVRTLTPSGATTFTLTVADMEAAGIPASGMKHSAWWSKSNIGGRALDSIGFKGSLRTVDGEKVLVLSAV